MTKAMPLGFLAKIRHFLKPTVSLSEVYWPGNPYYISESVYYPKDMSAQCPEDNEHERREITGNSTGKSTAKTDGMEMTL
jgi:hypothetical protein